MFSLQDYCVTNIRFIIEVFQADHFALLFYRNIKMQEMLWAAFRIRFQAKNEKKDSESNLIKILLESAFIQDTHFLVVVLGGEMFTYIIFMPS